MNIETIPEDLRFGVEIEFYATIPREEVQTMLQANNVDARVVYYTNKTTQHWKILRDGSLDIKAGEFGMELVSPILSGRKGLTEVQRCLTTLQEIGVRTDSSTGLHVHISPLREDWKLKELRSVVLAILQSEQVLDKQLPVTRRGDNCLSSKSNWKICQHYLDQVNSCSSVEELIRYVCPASEESPTREESVMIIEPGINGNSQVTAQSNVTRLPDASSRYYKLNLESLLSHATIEFRAMEATTCDKTVTKWICTLLQLCKNKSVLL